MPLKLEKRLGRRIVELRKKQAMLQTELAKRSGFSTQYLSGIENGKRDPSLTTIAAVAEALEVSMADLLKGLSPRKDQV